uniref:Dpy-19-like protein 3 n=1 Tax=Magallana gigas TaxID=29159 RepID=K1PWP7_MAGGI
MTEIRRRRPYRNKSGGGKNGYLKSRGGQGEAVTYLGMSPQQLLTNGAGLLVCLWVGYKHASYMALIHDNNTWFSSIKEVEREISFRTESGLYYSYYKQMVQAPSISQGLHSLVYDNVTEHPDTINVLERMNVYQEVVLSVLYRILPIKTWMQPIFFYINSVFALHAMLVWALFLTAYFLSGSWLAGILTACFYTFNKLDTTRVEYIIPLRESFSLPFLWVQIAATTYYFRHNCSPQKERLSVFIIFTSTLCFSLCWQFNQFVLLLQAFALFGTWILDMVPPRKIQMLLVAQMTSLLVTCLLQFINKMILGSLVMSFIPAALLLIYLKGEEMRYCSIPSRIIKVIGYSLTVLVFMILLQRVVKLLLGIDADDHIYKFIMSKFNVGHARDFDALLYLCIDAFGFLQFDTFERLTNGVVFPLYVVTHLGMLIILFVAVLQNWRIDFVESCSNHVHDTNVKDHSSAKKFHLLSSRPELAYHAVLAVFFGALGMSTLRMKYLWTPYMCILGSIGISDYKVWRTILSPFKTQGVIIQIVRHFMTLLTLTILLAIALPPLLKELEELKEFWDPDTVELMEWIKSNVPKGAAFTGSMQLLAGVKLCTGRPITNHPHYEDKHLRFKTKELYQIYGRRTPKDVHAILTKYKSSYIILEDSICLAPSKGCRTPDIVDIDNGIIPDTLIYACEKAFYRF